MSSSFLAGVTKGLILKYRRNNTSSYPRPKNYQATELGGNKRMTYHPAGEQEMKSWKK